MGGSRSHFPFRGFMPALDLSQSAFAQTRLIAIETPAAAESSWRGHVVARLAGIAKVAVVATTLALSVSASFGAEAQPHVHHGSSASVVTAQDQAIVNSYRAEMLSPKMAETWKASRPDLQIFRTFGGVDHKDDRPLSAKAGVSLASMDSTDAERLKTVDADFLDAGKSIMAISMSMPNAYFHADAKAKGDVCMVQVNAEILGFHKDIAKATGMANDVIRDYLIRHEMSHCVEHSDVDARLVSAVFKSPGDAVQLTASREAGINAITPPRSHEADYLRQKIELDSGKLDTHKTRHESEEYADGLSLLSLVVEGRADLKDVRSFAKLRESMNESGAVHQTAQFLESMANKLQDDPKILAGLKTQHAQDIASGKGLQIQGMESWMNKLWQENANAPFAKADATMVSAPSRAESIVKGSLFASLSQAGKPAPSTMLRP